MLFYSHRPRFIFIHVIKTGGTSIREALAPHARWPGGAAKSAWTRLRRRLDRTRLVPRLGLTAPEPLAVLQAHATAADVRAALPEETFNRYFKFAFVRNPWDWLVSWYHYLGQSPSHPEYAVVSGMKDFEGYLAWRVGHAFQLQKHMVAGPEGQLLVDFVGRFEKLEEDFGKVCATVGVRADLAHHNQSRHRDYRFYYTNRTRELVETFWAEDIEFFGYQFDPPASPYHAEWAVVPPSVHVADAKAI